MAGQATCQDCLAGTYQASSGQQSCADYTVCQSGYIEGVPGTTTTDRTCVASEWTDVFGGGTVTYEGDPVIYQTDDQIFGSALDSDGNLLVAGQVCGTLTGQSSTGNCDAFVKKYTPSGTVVWTRQFGSTGQDGARGVAVDSNDRVIVAGISQNGFGGELALGGSSDGFLRVLDSDGTVAWTRIFGTIDYDEALGVTVDSSNRITAVGFTYGDMTDFTNAGGADYMVVQYDSDGVEQWVSQIGTDEYDEARSAAAAPNGDVAVVGVTTGSIEASVDGDDIGSAFDDDGYLQVFNSAGTVQWSRQFGTTSGDSPRGVAFDPSGNLYIVGETYGVFVVGQDLADQDGFARKYASNGTVLWSRQFGTALADNVWSICGVSATGVSYGGRVGTNNAMPGYEATAGRINASGVEQWYLETGTLTSGDAARACSANTTDAVFLSGYTGLAFGGSLDAREAYVSRVVDPTP